MSLRKRDRSDEGRGSEQESKREKRRRHREAARRQKALAESERKRRKEAEKAGAEADAKKPSRGKPVPKQPDARKAPEETKPGPARKPRLRRPVRKRGSDKRPDAAPRAATRLRGGTSKLGNSARKLGAGIVAVLVEVLKLGREMLVIPLQLWLAAAEVVGGVVLKLWLRALLPALRLLLRLLLALLHFGERHVTPARALGVVALVAIAALVASQWRDYSAVSVGTYAYAGDVGSVAPAPEVSSAPAHDAHGPTLIILAALATVALIGAFVKRRRLSIWLVAIGLAVLVVSLAIDAPKGLDEGAAAVTYESAHATLLSGFWLQIAAAVVLIGCGLLLPRALRPDRAPASTDADLGPSLIDRLVARTRTAVERRRARPKKPRRRLPRRLRRPSAKGKVQGAGT